MLKQPTAWDELPADKADSAKRWGHEFHYAVQHMELGKWHYTKSGAKWQITLPHALHHLEEATRMGSACRIMHLPTGRAFGENNVLWLTPECLAWSDRVREFIEDAKRAA